MTRIVAGIDGSPASSEVLAAALDEAATHRLPLTVVAVHPAPPPVPSWGMPSVTPSREDLERTKRAAHALVDAAVAASATYAGVIVTVKIVSGVPAEELLAESTPQDRLIVGSRRAGGFRRAFLGSVSSDVVHSASCQVTVVPTTRSRNGSRLTGA
jgi:nucleotide-binding universal stress UspA family protein